MYYLSKACECDPDGSVDGNCDDLNGICTCKEGFTGEKCDECALEHFGFPNCQGMLSIRYKLCSYYYFHTIF